METKVSQPPEMFKSQTADIMEVLRMTMADYRLAAAKHPSYECNVKKMEEDLALLELETIETESRIEHHQSEFDSERSKAGHFEKNISRNLF